MLPAASIPTHELYLANRDVIERALASVCRRNSLSPTDAEDFSSGFRLRLIETDCASIRAFSGRSSLQTYLLVVITHYFQDWRNARWGKWRPSAQARRLGEAAVRLETLTIRDGLTLDQAFETMRSAGFAGTRSEVEQLAAQFPVRHPRTFVTDEVLQTWPSVAHAADALVEAKAQARAAARSTSALKAAISELAPEDQLILQMRFQAGTSIADIARALCVDQKPLYRRIDRLIDDLRAALESAGITAELAAEALGDVRPLRQVADPLEESTT